MPRLRTVSLVALAVAAGGCGAYAQDAPPQPAMMAVMKVPVEKSRAAIAECRQRRERGEFKTYRESAACSNPRIFAAWREANYPHMDLITAWLNAREEGSDKVDQHNLAPREFEEQMAALTVRLTAEEQRRRAGLIVAADGDLRLQLPSAAQVVGVATPAADEKFTAKRSAIARERGATALQFADETSSAGVGALAELTPLDGQRMRPGVGGPFVPVAANSPAARAAMAAAAPGEGSNGLYAELAAQRSEAEARATYRYLQGQYPTLLASRDAVIRRTDDSGTYFRVEIGPLTSSQADQLCGAIKAGGGRCVARYE